ncbi:hypothetical protein C1645_836900 [Glomus cerebriforme]|uniref:Uncharacterized protein n=1 Tax=Glomus cerebriforme TaxID=658196 RepID=A0A397SGD7_9GLOM|nr:hypothetical protein C1645_841036 [Glomus cerebriforme]RIA81504.1 hypothetical protein C1645_836900 [Glomus cerebriforme]
MDENLFYDQHSFAVNSSNESLDFFTEVAAITERNNMTGMSGTSCGRATFNTETHTMQDQQILQIISYLKFYYFSPDDKNFYYVTCKIVLQDDFNDHHNHGFFFRHPNDPSIVYFVSCKLLSFLLIENILNNGMDFDVKCDVLLSLQQKLNLEQNLKQRLFDLMYYNRNANSNGSMTNYNNICLPSNDHQDTHP